MAGKDVSYQFLDALAKSVGTADEQMYGHVKIAHEVTNDSTDGVAVSPDAVYAYAPNRDTTPLGMVIYPSAMLIIEGEDVVGEDVFAQLNGNALSVSWGNTSYANLSQMKITIPAPYKYKAVAPFIARTNAGVGVSVDYKPRSNAVIIERAETDFKPYDSILILLAPDNA